MEARGFIVGVPIAMTLGVGFVMLRKPSKLPCEKYVVNYGLEARAPRSNLCIFVLRNFIIT
jgi:adenine/guanine phosphoribosyltransferase-like PRPP-binding protein